MSRNKLLLVLAVLVLGVLALSACAQATPQVVEKVVTVEVTKEVEKQVEVTKEVTKEVQVEVTPTVAPKQCVAKNPDTITEVTYGDIDTMDPALAYDTASGQLILNVMSPLITYNGTDATTFQPDLATEVPTAENGGITNEGKTYTFKIRQGVKFHEGGDLTPSDVAYSLQRGLLQSDPNGPQWLLIEPIMGFTSGDITEKIDEGKYAGDREGLIKNAKPEDLKATCEAVQKAIVADDAAGTVTLNLAQSWGPLLATLAQSWGMVLDKEWAVEKGDWDGSCDTWQNFYAVGKENDKLTAVINGTGPYKLAQWTPGQGYSLVANDAYWRTDNDPVWPGGPAGKARIKNVEHKEIQEWGTRFAMFQAGDADIITVDPGNRPQADEYVGETCDYKTGECKPTDKPTATGRSWAGLPNPTRTDIFMNFNIATDDKGNNPYIGSGKLDGNGIPADFFSDIHVRKAMATCFDYDTYIAEGLNGDGVRNNGPIILDMLGYNPNGPMYEYNLDTCKSELEQAWGGKLPETGFRFQITYNTGNAARQTIAEILQANLAQVNEKYKIEILSLPWPTLLAEIRAKRTPMFVSGWAEDIHDPHNWVGPFTTGTYASRQNMPAEMKAKFQEFQNAGVATADPKEREKAYFAMQQYYYDNVPAVTGAQVVGKHYEQCWVKDWIYNPIVYSIGYNFYQMDLARQ